MSTAQREVWRRRWEPRVERVTSRLPAAEAGELRGDLEHWMHAAYALFQLPGPHQRTWHDALKAALLRTQVTDGAHARTWTSGTVRGERAGSVTTTALAALCLEVWFRYARSAPF